MEEKDQAVEEVELSVHCHAAAKRATKYEQELEVRREQEHPLATIQITKERECWWRCIAFSLHL